MVQLHQCTTVWCELDILASFSFWTSLVSAGKIIPASMLLIYYPMFSELILETSAWRSVYYDKHEKNNNLALHKSL